MKTPLQPTPKSEVGNSEESLFLALYHEHFALVRRVIFRTQGDRNLDDLVQQAFIRIWKGLKRFRGDAALKTWVYRIAMNTAIDSLRKRKKERLEESFNEEQVSGKYIEPADERIRKELVSKGLASLSKEHREVLVLHVYEGLSIQEISEVIGKRQGTIKSRLYFARKKMGAYLEANGIEL